MLGEPLNSRKSNDVVFWATSSKKRDGLWPTSPWPKRNHPCFGGVRTEQLGPHHDSWTWYMAHGRNMAGSVVPLCGTKRRATRWGEPLGEIPSDSVPAEDAMPGSVAAMSTGSCKSQTRYRTLEMERWGSVVDGFWWFLMVSDWCSFCKTCFFLEECLWQSSI